ncbi:MAG TPA: hypothetical protein VNT27_02240 [Propionibacteriaceae bacterium]|nr:hypothetical protein [Propionibacteriaceae bacterium]
MVGALFNLGAFLTEVWAQSVDRERDIASIELHELREEGNALIRELNAMEKKTRGNGGR